jgi:hypothetical protein
MFITERTISIKYSFKFDELEFLALSEQTYLRAGTLQCIYLYIHQDSNKLFIALFIPNSCRVFIGILDDLRENHMPNLNKLLKNECEKRLQREIDTNLLPINEHQFEVKVNTDSQNIWKRFNRIISSREYNRKNLDLKAPSSEYPIFRKNKVELLSQKNALEFSLSGILINLLEKT